MNILLSRSRQSMFRLFSQSLLVGIISATGVLTGWIPGFSGESLRVELETIVLAQSFTDEEISNYARAVLAMEPRRQQAYKEIKQIVGNVPPVVCNVTKNINTLPRNIRGIAVSYCEYAKQLIESNGLTVNRFNAITRQVQGGDEELKKRIQSELIRLQTQANP